MRLLHLDFFDRLERITYDLRVRAALHFPAPAATNLAFVAMEDSSIAAVKSGQLGYTIRALLAAPGLWPARRGTCGARRQAVAFDVLFGELRKTIRPCKWPTAALVESDDFFALQMRRAGNVIIAVTPELRPPDLFATNALALGDISTDKDSDGTLRRVEAFHDLSPLASAVQKGGGANLASTLTRRGLRPGKIILPQTGSTNLVTIPVDAENNFELADFVGDKLPPGAAPKAKAFTDERVWHMGIVLAAQELKLDLAHAEIDLPRGKIILRGANGVERVIPVDDDGYFLH